MTETIVTHVGSGQTLSEIAARHNVTVEELQRWNHIENPDYVQVGQTIVVRNPVDAPGSDSVAGDWVVGIGCAIFLALLLFLFRRKRGAATPVSRAPSSHRPQSAPVAQPRPAPKANDGELFVGRELTRRYRDWILLNDVMLPSGQGTAQIDHVLLSPAGVFLIETKDMNGWVFGSPGEKQWTQSFAAGRWSREAGSKTKRFTFYNPLLQNEGHANALVNLGIAGFRQLRPIAVFVGDAELKTADKFLPFDEHEKIASRNRTWRMRGVICMGVAELHRYIALSVDAPSNPGLTREGMETVRNKIRAAAIPVTAESHARHVEFVRSAREKRATPR